MRDDVGDARCSRVKNGLADLAGLKNDLYVAWQTGCALI